MRSLAASSPLTVGVGYSFQLVDRLPAEDHDEPLDAIVTPSESWERK